VLDRFNPSDLETDHAQVQEDDPALSPSPPASPGSAIVADRLLGDVRPLIEAVRERSTRRWSFLTSCVAVSILLRHRVRVVEEQRTRLAGIIASAVAEHRRAWALDAT
jgi:hypothetical protein